MFRFSKNVSRELGNIVSALSYINIRKEIVFR